MHLNRKMIKIVKFYQNFNKNYINKTKYEIVMLILSQNIRYSDTYNYIQQKLNKIIFFCTLVHLCKLNKGFFQNKKLIYRQKHTRTSKLIME